MCGDQIADKLVDKMPRLNQLDGGITDGAKNTDRKAKQALGGFKQAKGPMMPEGRVKRERVAQMRQLDDQDHESTQLPSRFTCQRGKQKFSFRQARPVQPCKSKACADEVNMQGRLEPPTPPMAQAAAEFGPERLDRMRTAAASSSRVSHAEGNRARI